MTTEHTAQEISRLRRCVNDLASILGLPAMWTGHDSSRVTTTLLAWPNCKNSWDPKRVIIA